MASTDVEKQTRVSPLRVAVLVVIVALVVPLGIRWWVVPELASPAEPESPFFAGYVDVTATPEYEFEAPPDAAQSNVILAFVVADTDDPCLPTWGTYYTLETATSELDLERRITQLRTVGGDVSVSFGGQANTELAVGCTDPAALQEAYQSVVDRYALRRIDLDIEGAALSDGEAMVRRAQAVAAVQQAATADGQALAVWLTLPVATTGLTDEGVAAVRTMLDQGVDLSGVNGMTMNFGGTLPGGQTMAQTVVAASTALRAQLSDLYAGAGQGLNDADVWARLGVTPMIGQNDLPDEVFTLDDALTVNTFARDHGVGLLSMWSLNRDATCLPPLPKTVRVVQASCSGIDQDGLSFAQVLASGTDQSPTATSRPTPSSSPNVTDDPKTSPFPIWDPLGTYPANTRVTWKRNVYRAKYWTSGVAPDDPATNPADTPWVLVGPVLPGDKPAPLPTLPAGTYPKWNPSQTYDKGQRVQVNLVPYEAKWWTRGQMPGEPVAGGSPWVLITPN